MIKFIITFFLSFYSLSIFPNTVSIKAIDTVLNDFHSAASKANGKKYFSLFSSNGVFIGTDANERWSVKEFKLYASPYFKKGKGWTYIAKKRNIDIAKNLQTAWFDEILENKSYGLTRGSGVLIKENGSWKISQYHLTIPIPNSLAKSIVDLIQKRPQINN